MNPAPSVRARWRLLLLLGLAFVWWLRWTTVQTSSGAEIQAGPERTGAVGAFALLLSWGYAATLLAAGRARGAGGMRVGAALTDAVVAGLAAVGIAQSLLATAAVGWAAFAALALLALLQVLVSGRCEALTIEVAFVRSVAALGVGVLLIVAGAWTTAGLALGLAASAFVPALPRSPDAVRRGLEFLLLLLALVVLFAPQLHDRAAGLTVERTGVYEGYFLWILGGVGLALLAAGGLRRREDTA